MAAGILLAPEAFLHYAGSALVHDRFACLVHSIADRGDHPTECDVYSYIVHRTQIYLDDNQTARLDQRAAAEGVTRSTVIRRAVDDYLAGAEDDQVAWRARWRQAVAQTAGIAPHLADGDHYVQQLRATDADRLRELEM